MSIKIEHLNYVYSAGTAYEKHALKDICLEIPHGELWELSDIQDLGSLR